MSRIHGTPGFTPQRGNGRSGFTLVEMLVSTALVMLIMVLFAQVYTGAAGTIREQEGIAKNDQKARSLSLILRRDLDARTYRERLNNKGEGVVPLWQNVEVDSRQKGFFFFSEGMPGDDTDDILSFTVFLIDGTKLVGPCDTGTTLNHPDMDDGRSDGMTASRAAVVTYYLRNGNLCRRINLLRDPRSLPVERIGTPSEFSSLTLPTQPSSAASIATLGTASPLYTAASSNWYETNSLAYAPNATPFQMLGISGLDNDAGLGNNPVAYPWNRFGHAASGVPQFGDTAGVTAKLPGAREGEEILLSNVQAMDVQVWEPQEIWRPETKGRFVQLGYTASSGNGGRFSSSGRLNTGYSANIGAGSSIFDTWHPRAPAGTFQNVPFQPLRIDPTNASTWTANMPVTINMTRFDKSTFVFPTGDPTLGFYAYAPVYPLSEDLNGNLMLDPGEDRNGNGGTPDVTVTEDANNNHFLDAGEDTNGNNDLEVLAPLPTTGSTAPTWGVYVEGDGVYDGNIIWRCFSNRAGLTLMRIAIRYRDPGSNLSRQITIDHSFIEK